MQGLGSSAMKLKDAKLPTDTIEAALREETHGDLVEIAIQEDVAGRVYLSKEDTVKFAESILKICSTMS